MNGMRVRIRRPAITIAVGVALGAIACGPVALYAQDGRRDRDDLRAAVRIAGELDQQGKWKEALPHLEKATIGSWAPA